MSLNSNRSGHDPRVGHPDDTSRHTLFITLVAASAFFMEMFDSTVIVSAMPAMQKTSPPAAI